MLTVTPIDFAEANAFVATLHRHHKPMPGCKFCIAVSDEDGKVRGVAMVGRPVARNSDNGYTLEVNRCCTDGARNACSMLYGAAWRAAKALGYHRLMTYTLPAEGGVSLRAAGWKLIGERGGGTGTCQVALASIPQKYCKDRNYYGKPRDRCYCKGERRVKPWPDWALWAMFVLCLVATAGIALFT